MIESWSVKDIDMTGFFHYMEQPGTSTDNASVSKIFSKLGVNDIMLDKVMKNPKVSDFIRSRYQPKQTSLPELKQLPINTLGYQWADLLEANNLQPKFFVNEKHDDDRTYLINRLHDTHDIWHIVLGFDTSEPGESGMNAFTYAQAYSPTTCMLMAAKLVRAIQMDETHRHRMMHNISRGYRLGLALEPFLAVAWEDHWDCPVNDLRQQVGLTDALFH